MKGSRQICQARLKSGSLHYRLVGIAVATARRCNAVCGPKTLELAKRFNAEALLWTVILQRAWIAIISCQSKRQNRTSHNATGRKAAGDEELV